MGVLRQPSESKAPLAAPAELSAAVHSGMRPRLHFWLAAFFTVLAVGHALVSLADFRLPILWAALAAAAAPLAASFFLIGVHSLAGGTSETLRRIVPYLLFFSISVTSLSGYTQTLTGLHAESSNVLLYGLSFYTASLAFLAHRHRVSAADAWLVSNPMLLMTGPVATFFKDIRYKSFASRWNYYGPFVVLGLFLHQVVATPLTNLFGLIERTDVVSSLTFALIFELFVYANFCGLSLIVFGAAGILGYRVPLNFKQPFSSTHLIDFWKGWHTSLSQVLKELFYTPVRAAMGTSMAIAAVYMASAMWHGVTLNFLLWGAFHAICYLLTLKLLKARIPVLPTVLLVFGVVIGRLIFSDSDSDRLLAKLAFSYQDFSVFEFIFEQGLSVKAALGLILVFVGLEIALQRTRLFRKRNYKFYRAKYAPWIILLLIALLVFDDAGLAYSVYGQR